MYTFEVYSDLPTKLRRPIDELIHRSWSFEAMKSGDVEILVPEGSSVSDPIDHVSHHVVARNQKGSIVGYGRVAITQGTGVMPGKSAGELDIPSYIQRKDPNDRAAYISRLVVDPAHRGRGIATMIHKTRIEIASNLGAGVIYGWAVGDLPRNALTRVGFVEVGERQGFTTSWYITDRTTRLVKLEINPAPTPPSALRSIASSI